MSDIVSPNFIEMEQYLADFGNKLVRRLRDISDSEPKMEHTNTPVWYNRYPDVFSATTRLKLDFTPIGYFQREALIVYAYGSAIGYGKFEQRTEVANLWVPIKDIAKEVWPGHESTGFSVLECYNRASGIIKELDELLFAKAKPDDEIITE